MSLSHFARGAIAAENGRRMMMLRGFPPNGHRLWDRVEAGNLEGGYSAPSYASNTVVDYDCAGGSGNGPRYVQGPFILSGPDIYGLDADNDGIACEIGEGGFGT